MKKTKEPPNESSCDAKQKKQKSKVVLLKQWLVSGTDKDGNRLNVFLLATCGLKAREAMQKRYEGCKIWNVMQSAESDKTSDWLETHSPFYS